MTDFFRSHGIYLVPKEIFAIIRRIDVDGDARISFKEFKEFFDQHLSGEAPLIPSQHQESPSRQKAERTWKQKQGLKHRSKVMQTPSLYDATIQKDIERMQQSSGKCKL